jgi:acetyl-CoA synthetase
MPAVPIDASARPDAYQCVDAAFEWQSPEYFNMAQACCERWAARQDAHERIAIRTYGKSAKAFIHTYAELADQAKRLSAVLHDLGVVPGDRVAIVLPQRFETAVAYMAVLQMGAVAMPLSMLFGPEALAFRLQDSAAVLAIADAHTAPALQSVKGSCPSLRQLLTIDSAGLGLDYADALASATTSFEMVATRADAAAVLIYTSGTTGNPKGALIPHRALLGNLTGFVCSQNGFGLTLEEPPVPAAPSYWHRLLPQMQLPDSQLDSDAVFWSPADWAWTGGLMDALLPTLYFGRPIVACSERFSPQLALELMRDCAVTHSFLFPTALKALMKAYPGAASGTVRTQFALKLQAIMSAGEAVGDAVFGYCQRQLGVTVNEMFGQTEINYIVGNCAALWPPRPGSMGMAYPGHRVAVIDENGCACAPGVVGDVAVNRFALQGQLDPVFFFGLLEERRCHAGQVQWRLVSHGRPGHL